MVDVKKNLKNNLFNCLIEFYSKLKNKLFIFGYLRNFN